MNIRNTKDYIYDVIGALYAVHKELGPGLNENVYQEGLKLELTHQQIPFEKELSFHPFYKGVQMETTYRLDFLVRNDIIIELKAVSQLTDDHRSQLFNYMHLTKPVSGILVNFASKSCQIERYIFDKETNTILTIEGMPIQHRSILSKQSQSSFQ